ncbi:MAG: sodium-translocating pyrophosphatase [Planctomycetota bacterium]
MYALWNILSLVIAAAGMLYAYSLFQQIMRKDAGDETMQKIARAVQEGGRAFLHAEYKWLAVFVVVVFVALCMGPDDGKTKFLGWKTAVAFLMGSVASAGAGYFGMHCATRAAVRTTQAAKTSLGGALDVAFKSGTVMGMTVVGVGLLGISVLMLAYQQEGVNFVNYVLGFSFGASSIALFARVGGGIYTKAADVGGDLVGKVEAGIPEDDPRNPAVIADNVGDNVGDVAGMGADLFESDVGAILSTAIIGWALVNPASADKAGDMTTLLMYPIVLSAVGVVASFLGTFRVKADDESKLSAALFGGLIAASVFLVLGGAVVTMVMKPAPLFVEGKPEVVPHWNVYFAMVVGLVVGVIIGKVTEYYTSEKMAPAQTIAQQSQTGAATNIIYGLATGMASTWIPTVLLALAIYLCNDLAGMYGICVAAVGMLSTLGISLGVDAYGPVADNAGGLAEMSHQPPEVRKRTDSLDATGNTTAAIGKGFAIGSAALTALALFSAYKVAAGSTINLSLDNANVVMGLLVGGMLPFVFSSMAMKAVGKAANAMVEEVRRQFRTIPGLKEGTCGEADYARCVAISTEGALREMVVPGLLAIVAPVAMGMIFGKSAVGGLLAGSTAGGVMMALFMANAGGAWDNAKKYIEAGHLGGKGSDTHKAAVTGDTVGDPFKDTAGPSINILMKLMTIAALIALPLFKDV